jgi:two-component system cell cycle sensor histidine kinase/response regulator CckA
MLNILAIDDETEITEILRDIFSAVYDDCTVDTCAGVEGVDGYTKSKRYDIICSDYMMPNVKGDEIIKIIRTSHELNASTPILMISGHINFKRDENDPIWKDVYFVQKPINPQDLMELVNKLIKKSA